jgi:hypothetical protein
MSVLVVRVVERRETAGSQTGNAYRSLTQQAGLASQSQAAGVTSKTLPLQGRHRAQIPRTVDHLDPA